MQQGGNQFVKASSGWPKACYGVDLHGGDPVVVLAEKKRGKVLWNRVQLDNTTLAKAVGDLSVTATSLSARDSLTRRLEVPFSSRTKANRVLPTLLDIQLPFSVEDCQYQFLDHSKTNAGTVETLAVVATNDSINSKIAAVKDVGFDPEIVDVEGLAVWSQILNETASIGHKSKGMVAVLILDGESSSLTIGRDGSFLNSYGLHVDDIKRVFRLVKAHQLEQGEKMEWFLAGAEAADEEVALRWREGLASLSLTDVKVVESPVSFLARAVAVRALSLGSVHCNLRSGEIAHHRIVGHSHGVQLKFTMLWLLVGLLLSVGNIVLQRNLADRKDMVNKRFRGLVDSLAGYHVNAMGDDATRIVADSMFTRKKELEPFLQAFLPSLQKIIVDIADVAKKEDLHYDTLSVGHDSVSIHGSASSTSGSDELVKTLAQAGYVVTHKRGGRVEGDRVEFTITTEQD
ncbi:MAG: pilus assembly protein PilM [Kiritimatiellae bacterium]|nr:pilus assembly protein PilM [Kiritimatiellia bacterium]